MDLDEDYPWGDVAACRNRKTSRETGVTEVDVRQRLKGVIGSCPKCGKPFNEMDVFYFTSPKSTWPELCGRAGCLLASSARSKYGLSVR